MNILELDSFNLADAVKFNDQLNPRIWQGQKMRPEVREKLLEIAADFKEFLGLSDLEVKDITVSGSNAGYTYTPYSDIDLHLVVDIPQADSDEVYRELFDAKKFQYNETHNIKIGGYDVELYVENANKPPVSQGVFSVLNNNWINIPRQRKATVNDDAVRSKYEDIKHRIDSAIDSQDTEKINTLAKKIKAYRQAGLDKHGELGSENLAYKMLRNQGYIKKLYDARTAARDRELSLAEQNRKKKPFVYGYKSVKEDVGLTPDGVSPSTKMFLSEKDIPSHTEIIFDFMRFVVHELELHNVPKLKIRKDPQWSVINKSFGRYRDDLGQIDLAVGNRHIMDVLRTLAHELQHRKQDEREHMPPDAGATGSRFENEAHAVAGVLMRKYADLHPEYFEDVPVNEASGYIPTRAQAQDPRFKMALTVDVHPGQTGQEANKMALKTDKQGKPGLLMKTANMIGEAAKPRSYGYGSTPLTQEPGGIEDALGNQEATGPEFPPQMPAGTTKIDVSDLTDWYRLGMDISDMDDADPEDYNQGPPQTVIVFPSDEAEQGYLKQFKRLGLKTHDMDPDVKGGEDLTGKHLHKKLAEELEEFKEQDLFEVKMTSGNLAKLARDIKGAKVGLEFEMIVPNASVEDDGDMEPDYDEDRRVRDIDDAVNFFDDGDYNSHRELDRLRDAMQEAFWIWRAEKLDEDWYENGREYFEEYLDREDPFDEEDAEQEARNELQTQYGDELSGEDFDQMLYALIEEKREAYAQEQWDNQNSNFDDARQEYDDEHRDDYSEEDWLRDQSIRFASDVESNFGHVTWPYYTSNSNQGETDIKRIALEFMNDSGLPYDNIAIANSYHGRYELWDGDQWIDYGSEKPDFCFAVEPDGSLDGNDSDDAGLEFVSPPIPLEQVGDVMSKVQQWAAANGVYTGKRNKTSIHTNISIPGYSIKDLDYLKAALLLGDEYVLREFDRIGNSYAKPAIEKVRELVKSRPEKAKELLDKMKSQLNAEASKLIHSGQTDKFTSINTKNNRIEFRSPGGDYLSDIADNPKKMQDTINRMVVAMDAAMDPNKYKQEYQKKLYKMLTGQTFGREAESGKKKEIKKDDKDLLNIFSRYAAGELPKAALKSFVRQAQLQRKVAKGETSGKMWWNVKYNGQRMEVVADSENAAKIEAAKNWHIPTLVSTLNQMTAEPLRPYTAPPAGSELERIERQAGVGQGVEGLYRIYTTSGGLIAGDEYGSDQAALERAQHWAQRRGVDVVVHNAQGQEIGRVSASGEITPSAQQPGPTLNGRASNPDGNYVIVDSNNDNTPVYRFMASGLGDATTVLRQWEDANPGTEWANRYDPDQSLGQPGAAQSTQQRGGGTGPYEIYNRETGEAIYHIDPDAAVNDGEALDYLENYRNSSSRPNEIGVRRRTDAPAQQNQGNWGIWIDGNNRFANQPGEYARGAEIPLMRFPSREAAESWLEQQRASRPNLRTDINVREIAPRLLPGSTLDLQRQRAAQAQQGEREPVGDINLFPEIQPTQQSGGIINTANEPTTGSQVGQTYNPTGTGSFTGQWLVLNPNNQVIYRFGGIGNNQSDANRLAMDWLRQNPRQMVNGVSVVPELG